MSEVAAIRRQAQTPTPAENLAYTVTMLKELRIKVAGVDSMLTYLLDMAHAQASDVISGACKPQP